MSDNPLRASAIPDTRQMKHRLRRKRTLVLVVISVILAGGARSSLAATGSAIYTYDALGRVASVSYDTGVIVFYTYDANGNRLSQVVNVNAAILTWNSAVNPCNANCWGATLW